VILRGGDPMAMQTIVPTGLSRFCRNEELREIYSERLSRLVRWYRKHENDFNKDGHHLMKRSIFNAFCALRDLGFVEEAKELLQEAEVPESLAVG